MKRGLSVCLIFFVILVHPVPVILAVETNGLVQAGVAAMVKGQAHLLNEQGEKKELKSKQIIYLGQKVETGNHSTAQILLLDGTTFTVGPNSGITIDKFVFDPDTHQGALKANVAKGIFRFVTGKIGAKNPQSVEIDLPVGTIGIRGTIVAGEVGEKRSTVVLLGPGEKNNTQHRQGKFTLTTRSGDKVHQQTVSKTGFASRVEGEDGTPSRPFKISAEEIKEMTGSLQFVSSPDSEAADQGEESGENAIQEDFDKSATEQSGQDTMEAESSIEGFDMTEDLTSMLDDLSDEASQDALDEELKEFGDGLTTWDELQTEATVQGGFAHYKSLNFKIYDQSYSTLVGAGDFLMNVDFGNRSMGGGPSVFQGVFSGGALSGSFKFNLPSQNFQTGSDAAVYEAIHLSNSYSGGSPCVSPTCSDASVKVKFTNDGSSIAESATADFTIQDTNGGSNIANAATSGSKQTGAGVTLTPPV